MSSSRQRRIVYAQNFLHNPRLVRKLVTQSSLGAEDLALEIGPGDGAITTTLVDACRHVIAVEKDPYQVERLGQRFGQDSRLTLFGGDFLDFPLPASRYKVFASIPYHATAAIVGKLTTGVAPPDDAYLVVQREAANRFMGSPLETLVGLRLRPWFEPSIAFEFRRSDFRPAPAVDSVLLRIERRERPLLPPAHRPRFDDFVVSLFTAWKSTARQAAKAAFPGDVVAVLDRSVGQALDRRPSQIDLDAWIDAFEVLVELDDPRVWKAIRGASEKLEREQAGVAKRRRTSVATSRDWRKAR
ncbi:MAG: rRNA adenine N(6)-methyltransferase family protein [Chloroflexota bacterium]|nr:rRNA adenine N(6)-methyltransferase family protein [Chloroflexota bacterium]